MSSGLDRTLRLVGAALLVAQGVVHVQRWLGGYRGIPTIGTLFLVNAVLAVLVALVLVLRGGLGAALAGVVLSFATLAGFAFSRLDQIFGFSETVWDTPANVAVVVEVAAVVVLLAWATIAVRARAHAPTAIQRDLRRLGLATSS